MRHFNRVLVLVAAVLFISLTACSKKETANDSLFENEIISKLPASTFAFYTYNARRASFKKFQERPESKQFGDFFKDWREVASSGQSDLVNNVTSVLEALGLQPDGDDKSTQAEVFVAFATVGGAQQPISGGVYVGLPKKRSADVVLKQLKANLEKQQAKFSEREIEGTSGIAFKADSVEGEGGLELYAAGKGNKFAIVSDTKLVAALLSETDPQADQPMKTEAFKSVQQIIPVSKDAFMYGFVNVKPAVSFLQPLLAASPELRQQGLNLNDLPFDAIGYVANVSEEVESTIAVPLISRNEVQKNFIKRVQSGSSAEIAGFMPANTLMMLTVNGELIKAAMDLSKDTVGNQPEFIKYQKLLEPMKAISIGIRNNPLAPFPDVIVMAEADSGSGFVDNVIAELKGASQGFGMDAAWQQREVDGNKVNSVQTPFGIGIFVAQVKDYVVITSGEASVKDIGAVVKSGKGGLGEAFGKSTRGLMSKSSVVVANYFNFPLVADALATLGGTLAMFTGGQPIMEPEQIEELRSLGKMAVLFELDGDALKIRTRMGQ